MNDFQVSPHGAFKRGQQCSQSYPRSLNDDHECNAFLMMSLKRMFQVFNYDFSRGAALQGYIASCPSVLVRRSQMAMTLALKSYTLNKE